MSQPNRKPPLSQSAGGVIEGSELPCLESSSSGKRHYSIDEVAAMWNVHRATIRRLFLVEPGVIVLRTGAKRANGTMRIPQDVLDRVHRKLEQA